MMESLRERWNMWTALREMANYFVDLSLDTNSYAVAKQSDNKLLRT